MTSHACNPSIQNEKFKASLVYTAKFQASYGWLLRKTLNQKVLIMGKMTIPAYLHVLTSLYEDNPKEMRPKHRCTQPF